MKTDLRQSTLTVLILMLVFCLTADAAPGTNYYVSVTGSGINDGLTSTSAWPTIQWALERTKDNDIINVSTGVYAEWLQVTNSVTIIGADSYTFANPNKERHIQRTIIKPRVSPPPLPSSAMFELLDTNICLMNMTFDAEMNTNILSAVYSWARPTKIEKCTFANVQSGYGVAVVPTNASLSDDALASRSYFSHNLFTNIISTNSTGLLTQQAPANFAFNEFVDITGSNSHSAMYIFFCPLGTNPTTEWITVDTNYFDNCAIAIWANESSGDGEQILIRDNLITNSLIGIKVTGARGPATISNNTIYVQGTAQTTNATPARGIWIHADNNPWDTNGIAITDHQVVSNIIVDTGFNSGTIGMLFEYDNDPYPGQNNGVRATVIGNEIISFDYGIYLESGTNEIEITNSPLVDLDIHYNSVEDSDSYALYLESVTNTIDAQTNWWGSYTPANVVSGNVDISDSPLGNPYEDTDNDGTNDDADTDDDNDGLLDTNEVAIGTLANSADSDSDGQNDYDEYNVTGTDPTDNSSVFAASLSGNTNKLYKVLKWPSVAGRLYSVYRTTNIEAGFGATPITNGLFPLPPMNTYTDFTATGTSPYYYRVVVTNTL